jgi:lipoprotein-anchoring transpeptidase ErfK/SrfK
VIGAARVVGVGLLAACALVGLSAALAVTASAEPESALQATNPPPTEPDPPPTDPEEPDPPPRPAGIPGGITVAGVKIGGLDPYEAAERVRDSFARAVVLADGKRKFSVTADDFGARANIRRAIARARFSRPGARVPLHVWVPRERVRGFVESLAGELDRAAVSSRLVLDGSTVRGTRAVNGRRLERVTSSRAIRVALKTNTRPRITLGFQVVKPKVGRSELGPAIVIMRGSKKLRFFVGARLVRTFGVATGLPEYPTPLGNFEIVTMQRNPWWYPPPSGWAADSDPVPPGPGNPLGTRWMGISAPYVGIHGTPDAASIGYSASHGCIRMRISAAEWLFQRVKVGTPVFIVAN